MFSLPPLPQDIGLQSLRLVCSLSDGEDGPEDGAVLGRGSAGHSSVFPASRHKWIHTQPVWAEECASACTSVQAHP